MSKQTIFVGDRVIDGAGRIGIVLEDIETAVDGGHRECPMRVVFFHEPETFRMYTRQGRMSSVTPSKTMDIKRYTDVMHDIRRFHEKFGLAYNGPPRDLEGELARFRLDFLDEELGELNHAYADDRPEEVLDALVDLCYVAIGTAYLHGYDFSEAWSRVHAANMSKVRAESASDSKRGSAFDVVKPEGWEAPDLKDLVRTGDVQGEFEIMKGGEV